MNCENIQELIQHHLDLSLTNEQKTLLEKHVDACSCCREELASYEKLMGLLEMEQEVEVPEGFTASVMSKLPAVSFEKEYKGFGSHFEQWKRYAVPFAVGVAAVFAFTIFNASDSAAPERPELNPSFQSTTIAKRTIPTNEVTGDTGDELNGRRIPPKKEVQLASLNLAVEAGVVKVRKSDGSVQSYRSGSTVELGFQDELETGVLTEAHVTYPDDQIRLSLKPGSKIQVARNSIRLYHGDTWVHVVKKGTRFEVQTPNLIAAVRGTMFSTEVNYTSNHMYSDYSWYMSSASTFSHDSIAASADVMKQGLEFMSYSRDPELRASTVSVFEGMVNVRSLETAGDSVDLTEGQAVSSHGQTLARRKAIEESDYDKWGTQLAEAGIDVSGKRTTDAKQPQASSEGTTVEPVNGEIKPSETFQREFE
jgi:hypothetical protein